MNVGASLNTSKKAIVTGANRGIGNEIVRQLARRGVQVVLTARDTKAGIAAVEAFRADGLDVSFAQLDVTAESSIVEFSKQIAEQWDTVDILVNNAGVFLDRNRGVLNLELDTFRATMETNLYGPMRLVQVLFPFLKKSADGRIVNMSSGLGALADMGAGYVAYSLSKTALNALTIKMAAELKPHRILVNSMCPGWVKTEMGGPGATRTVEQGADTAVWLALDEIGGQSGLFFRDRQPRHW
jgi:NAD(P)-dependent dehydrogenase (short-subunit alcohol dehydrogenase family)